MTAEEKLEEYKKEVEDLDLYELAGDRAMAFLREAAEDGHPMAKKLLGMWLFRFGNVEEGRKWLMEALRSGEALIALDAAYMLGQSYSGGGEILLRDWNVPPHPIDMEKSIGYFLKGAEIAESVGKSPAMHYYSLHDALFHNLSGLSGEALVERASMALEYCNKAIDTDDDNWIEEDIGHRRKLLQDLIDSRQKGNKKDKSGCYLTTACVEYRGLDDDCTELTVLRGFRDDYMSKDAQRKKEIEEYYRTAPMIVEAISQSGCAESVYGEIYSEVIEPCVELIQNDCNEEAYSIYKTMVQSLRTRFC